MQNIFFFPKYNTKGASSRIRSFDYQLLFESQGFCVSFSPLFSNFYLNLSYANNLFMATVVALLCYVRRVFDLFKFCIKARSGDILWVEYELFPYMPSFFENIFLLKKCTIVFDFDDPIYGKYSNFCFLKSKFHSILPMAHLVFISSEAMQGDVIEILGPDSKTQTSFLPTPIDFDQAPESSLVSDVGKYPEIYAKPRSPFVVGWLGSPSAFGLLKEELLLMVEELASLNITFHIMGASSAAALEFHKHLNVHFFEWSLAAQIQFLDSLDVGLMPLDQTVWSTHRDCFKISLYSTRGIPVVAHRNSAHEDLVLTPIIIQLSDFLSFHRSVRYIFDRYPSNHSIFAAREYANSKWSRLAVFRSLISKFNGLNNE